MKTDRIDAIDLAGYYANGLLTIVNAPDAEVEALAVMPRYKEPVKALTCYKGIKHLFALTMITEIGDVKRFTHPRQLVSWIGMDIREYASGGKSNRLLLEGKIEIGKPTQFPLDKRAADQREAPGDRWW